MVVSGRQVCASRGLSCFACLCSGEEAQAEGASHEALLQERLKEAEERVAHLSTMIAGPPRFEVNHCSPATLLCFMPTILFGHWHFNVQLFRWSSVMLWCQGSVVECMHRR